MIEKFTEDFVFNTTIPRSVAVGEATATMQAIVETEKESPASFAFRKLAQEIKEIVDDEQEKIVSVICLRLTKRASQKF